MVGLKFTNVAISIAVSWPTPKTWIWTNFWVAIWQKRRLHWHCRRPRTYWWSPNPSVGVYSRLWCVYEAYLGVKWNKIYLLPVKPHRAETCKCWSKNVGISHALWNFAGHTIVLPIPGALDHLLWVVCQTGWPLFIAFLQSLRSFWYFPSWKSLGHSAWWRAWQPLDVLFCWLIYHGITMTYDLTVVWLRTTRAGENFTTWLRTFAIMVGSCN